MVLSKITLVTAQNADGCNDKLRQANQFWALLGKCSGKWRAALQRRQGVYKGQLQGGGDRVCRRGGRQAGSWVDRIQFPRD